MRRDRRKLGSKYTNSCLTYSFGGWHIAIGCQLQLRRELVYFNLNWHSDVPSHFNGANARLLAKADILPVKADMLPPTKAEIPHQLKRIDRQLRRTVPSPTKADIPPAKADTPPPAKLRRERHSLPIIRALSRLIHHIGKPDIVCVPDRLYIGKL